jgi:hypothetical protein
VAAEPLPPAAVPEVLQAVAAVPPEAGAAVVVGATPAEGAAATGAAAIPAEVAAAAVAAIPVAVVAAVVVAMAHAAAVADTAAAMAAGHIVPQQQPVGRMTVAPREPEDLRRAPAARRTRRRNCTFTLPPGPSRQPVADRIPRGRICRNDRDRRAVPNMFTSATS